MATSTTASACVPAPIYVGPRATIRPYCAADAPHLAHEANNPLIARFMRNLFPFPYTLADAESWITVCTARQPLRNFALFDSKSKAYAGGIGLKPLEDVECRTMEVGYWIGEAHWGKGIVTDALTAFVRWAFENVTVVEDRGRAGDTEADARKLPLLRLEAGVFEGNPASERVLQKAGFRLEGVRRKAAWKNGVARDIRIYGLLREECLGEEASAERPT